MSSPTVSASPGRLGSPLGAPIYPRHVELSQEEIAAKERRESAGILTSIRPPTLASDNKQPRMAATSESSYLWYAPWIPRSTCTKAHKAPTLSLRTSLSLSWPHAPEAA